VYKRQLLSLPGLSTQDEVSTGAGRGVGMDAVRQAVTQLGGEIELATEPGQGSRFILDVPATLMISEALLVRIGGRRFALPLPAVDRLLHVVDTLVVEQEGARFIDDAGEKLELVSAAELLRLEPGPPPAVPGATGVAVRLTGSLRGAALEVEEVFSASEVVIKSLGSFLSASTLIHGAFLDGDGEVVLLLDPQAMLERSRAEPARTALHPAPTPGTSAASRQSGPQHATSTALKTGPSAPEGPKILLTDDSLSVRRILARRLRRAGYEVLTARDGSEALDLMLEHEIAALITDLEMPNLSGEALIRRLRRHTHWRRLPILVITGRPGPGGAEMEAEAEVTGADPLGEALSAGDGARADVVLRKPVADGVIERWLESVLGRPIRARPDGARPNRAGPGRSGSDLIDRTHEGPMAAGSEV